MGDAGELIVFIVSVFNTIFTDLDSVYWGDYSLLDVFCTLLALDITIQFLQEVISVKRGGGNSD